jgi:hypothetical protein|tara:strand:+ start:336 stop:542 length:207 start_codon:yes stop_codon:yes gene_type:complete
MELLIERLKELHMGKGLEISDKTPVNGTPQNGITKSCQYSPGETLMYQLSLSRPADDIGAMRIRLKQM